MLPEYLGLYQLTERIPALHLYVKEIRDKRESCDKVEGVFSW